MCSNENVIKK